ncbi:helix-turn-helix domain-containing protein [Devosia sp.]|uniref:helix-turn-helix domain-containing protein n=1 Tax=Devosia sp. TaxID=1871048 RepID=UPI003F6FAD7B
MALILCQEHFLPMKVFADNLRSRAAALGLANAEVARRAGIPERTYANYVLDRTEPPLETLVRISNVLRCSIDDLLYPPAASQISAKEALLRRLVAVGDALTEADVSVVIAQAEALVAVRRRKQAEG